MTREEMEEITALRYMKKANENGVGLFGLSLWKGIECYECDRLCDKGFAKISRKPLHAHMRGYWITDAGLSALKERSDADPR